MLEGSLQDFSLPDVLRLLAFTSKTGRLTVHHGESRGRVDLLDGRIRDASADADRLPLARRVLGVELTDADTVLQALADDEVLPTDLQLARRLAASSDLDTATLADLVREQTIDAAFDLLRWEAGAFRFERHGDESRGPSALDLALGVDELLDETSRRMDAWPSLVARTGPIEGVVSIRRPGRDHAEVALPPDGWTLLSLVDGRRTLGDLVGLCGQGEYRTRRALGALIDEGVISVGDGDGLAPGERLLRDHRSLMAREDELSDTAAAAPAEPAAPAAPAAPAPPVAPPEVAVTEEAEEAEEARGPSLAERLATGAAEAPEPTPSEPAPAAEVAAERAPAPSRVRSLRTRVRDDRLRTDPSVDEDLVSRLIEGVEGL